MNRPTFVRISLTALFAFVGSFAFAKTDSTDDSEMVFLPKLVITEKTRGVVPLDFGYFYKVLTRTVLTELYLTPPMPADTSITISLRLRGGERIYTGRMDSDRAYDQHLENHGIKVGERIIAVDGRQVIGMSKGELERWATEEGDVGDSVTLVLRGPGETGDTCYFRELTVKRVSPQKWQKLRDAALPPRAAPPATP
jgi:hypothetical protein